MNSLTRSVPSLRAAMLAAVFSMVPAAAFAAGESAGVLATFAEYKIEAILIAVGFIIVLWSIKGVHLLKPKS